MVPSPLINIGCGGWGGGEGRGWRGVHFTGRLLHMGERVTIMDFLGGLQYQFLDQLANAGPNSLKVN